MDDDVADVVALTDALDLRGAVHVGHSTGGGEVARYVARAKPGRVEKAVLISAVAPLMIQTEANPDGVPIVVCNTREQTATNRAQFFYDCTLPFFGYDREGAQAKEGVRLNWWRQGMTGSILAHTLGIKAFSETEFTDDLKAISVPTLVLHGGDDDQVAPFAITGRKSANLVPDAKLISYPGFPHGMPTTNADRINADLLAFIGG